MAPASRLLVAAELADEPVVGDLFAGSAVVVLTEADLRVCEPWRGRIFDELSRCSGVVGLAVPVVWLSDDPAPEVVLVSDHVNLRLRGPLTGRRPVSGPPAFPSMSGIYQPALLRPRVGDRVYFEVVVAGVADAQRLTPFERREARRAGCSAACDCLVDTAIVAAHHGLKLAACGLPDQTTTTSPSGEKRDRHG